ncbi:MAG: ATP-binding cassette domain-containing protein [Gemmatimonadaceae bacterium]|nr:ATP-binding cassette domain-containing protein [Gemmatimonadaceae bacterium]
MIGSDPPQLQHRPQAAGAVALSVRGLSVARADPFGTDLQDINLQLHAGEILGVAGVSGNGQRELLACLSGEDRRSPPGTIALGSTDVSTASAAQRRQLGLHFVPEERLGRGAVPGMSLALNTLLTRSEPIERGWWINRSRLRSLAGRDAIPNDATLETRLPAGRFIHRSSRELIDRIDVEAEVGRRRQLYADVGRRLRGVRCTAIFPDLAAGTSPQGYPLIVEDEYLGDVRRALRGTGLELMSWPDLPDGHENDLPHYARVRLVNFL